MSISSIRAATSRLRIEYSRILEEPLPYIRVRPTSSDIFEWHFALIGPADTPFEGGVYHGKLLFPPSYPYSGPKVFMITPSGRFNHLNNREICWAMTRSYGTWSPSWTVSAVLLSVLTAMLEGKATEFIQSTEEEIRQFAVQSAAFNSRDAIFRELFPELL